jgi:hypothetical protein
MLLPLAMLSSASVTFLLEQQPALTALMMEEDKIYPHLNGPLSSGASCPRLWLWPLFTLQ